MSDRALTLEMLQQAHDSLSEHMGGEREPIYLMSPTQYTAAGRLGQQYYAERMERMAREAAHHIFGAIAVPTPTIREGANYALGGVLPTHRPPAPVPFEESWASIEREDRDPTRF